jgi:hypothetical protein
VVEEEVEGDRKVLRVGFAITGVIVVSYFV